jgi:Arc/MetJ-type ribon-helix-helix transcriptional regulator
MTVDVMQPADSQFTRRGGLQPKESPARATRSILLICQIGNTVSTMKTISLKLPAPLANWLAKRAHELGRSRSDLIRQALEEQRQGKNSKSEKSCAELMAEFSGFFQGPRDLSTNPKYMRDFGK